MSSFEAILFDFDGVLLDTEPVHFACWAEAVAPLGLILDWETYSAHCIGVDDRSMINFFAARSRPPADPARLWAQYPAKRDRFRERMAEHAFDPELLRLLRELHGRYRLAVVSSSGREEVEPLLVRGGVRGLFDALVCGGDVARRKPAPDPYLLAASLLGVGTALVVEDSDAGVESGCAAGFDVLRIDHAGRTPELLRARLSGQ